MYRPPLELPVTPLIPDAQKDITLFGLSQPGNTKEPPRFGKQAAVEEFLKMQREKRG